jgi:hypothetical protein
MIEDKAGTMQLFRRALGVEPEVEVNDTQAVRRLCKSINTEFEQRYRSSNNSYLEELYQLRGLSV